MIRQPAPDGTPVPGDQQPAGVQQVGIAVVAHQNHLLVGLRRADQTLAGFSEFPGGKCRSGEPVRDCVARECLEETGLTIEPVERLDRIEFSYPHGRVSLSFWLCRLFPRDSRPPSGLPTPHSGFHWHPVTDLANLNFPAANAPVLTELAARFKTKSGD
ncbi:MAG: (deoxy)nucleoside triphosphate pyrophosphohydrolase [Planctomycetaceae bacterium]